MKRLVLLATMLAACGGGDADPDPDADLGPQVDADVDPAPDFARRAGSIQVIETSAITGDETTYSFITAGFGTSPAPFVHTVAATAGQCRLLLWENPRCVPDCVDGACVAENTCESYPSNQSAGALTIDGLRDTAVLQPDALNGYTTTGNADLFAEGAHITARAAGDDVAAFELSVDAPDAPNLAVQGAGTLDFPAFAPDTDFTFSWNEPDPASRVFLRMAADAAHGQPFSAMIECDAPDTGSLTVPAALLTEYIDGSHWSCGECPTQTLTRYRAATADFGSETLELRVGNQVQFFYWGS
jgi:hypothetical protein